MKASHSLLKVFSAAFEGLSLAGEDPSLAAEDLLIAAEDLSIVAEDLSIAAEGFSLASESFSPVLQSHFPWETEDFAPTEPQLALELPENRGEFRYVVSAPSGRAMPFDLSLTIATAVSGVFAKFRSLTSASVTAR